MDVAGYLVCRKCGEWFVKGDGVASLVLCSACFRAAKAVDDQKRLKYEVEGRVFTTPAKKPRKRQKRTEGVAAYHRLWNRARSRAVTRLIQIDKPLFELLMAEEKERVGLKGGYTSGPQRDAAITRQVLDRIEAEE
jgi:hypothetical protein